MGIYVVGTCLHKSDWIKEYGGITEVWSGDLKDEVIKNDPWYATVPHVLQGQLELEVRIVGCRLSRLAQAQGARVALFIKKVGSLDAECHDVFATSVAHRYDTAGGIFVWNTCADHLVRANALIRGDARGLRHLGAVVCQLPVAQPRRSATDTRDDFKAVPVGILFIDCA